MDIALGSVGTAECPPRGSIGGLGGAQPYNKSKLRFDPQGGSWGSFFEILGSKRRPKKVDFLSVEIKQTKF